MYYFLQFSSLYFRKSPESEIPLYSSYARRSATTLTYKYVTWNTREVHVQNTNNYLIVDPFGYVSPSIGGGYDTCT